MAGEIKTGRCTSGVVPINKSKLIKLILGVIVTIACLVAAVWGIDFEQISRSFRQANYWTLPVMLALLFVFFWLKAFRWRMLLEPIKKLTVSQVTPAMMIGFMGNNILPAHLGEFLRVYVLSRQFQIPKTTVLSTVVLERLFDVVAILCYLGDWDLFCTQSSRRISNGQFDCRPGYCAMIIILVAGLSDLD